MGTDGRSCRRAGCQTAGSVGAFSTTRPPADRISRIAGRAARAEARWFGIRPFEPAGWVGRLSARGGGPRRRGPRPRPAPCEVTPAPPFAKGSNSPFFSLADAGLRRVVRGRYVVDLARDHWTYSISRSLEDFLRLAQIAMLAVAGFPEAA